MPDRYPPGVPCWVDTAPPDPEAATRFYGGLFGWTFEDRMSPDAPGLRGSNAMAGQYFVAQLRGRDVAAVGSRRPGAPPVPVWSTYICVENADDIAGRVREAGGAVLVEPFDVLDAGLRGPNAMAGLRGPNAMAGLRGPNAIAGRMAVCSDPAGAAFSVWQPGTHRGAQAVNEPGTWNWSDLYTSDLEGAKAFYGAVFGWEASTVNVGGEDATMWCLPGYSDVLETLDPGLRQRHAEFGAPEGFSDAIGWMMPMSGDDGPAQWSVTFAVADADATAAKAEELGGTVLVPPTDAGPVRLAVLRDPQGAVFSVSRFDPDARA